MSERTSEQLEHALGRECTARNEHADVLRERRYPCRNARARPAERIFDGTVCGIFCKILQMTLTKILPVLSCTQEKGNINDRSCLTMVLPTPTASSFQRLAVDRRFSKLTSCYFSYIEQFRCIVVVHRSIGSISIVSRKRDTSSRSHRYHGTRPYRSCQPRSDSHLVHFFLSKTRHYATGKGRGDTGGFKMDALPFSVSPEEALLKFNEWATKEQGLDYLLQRSSIMITAAYCPVWCFDLNIRYAIVSDSSGEKPSRRYGWKPAAFSDAYGLEQSVIHVPGLAAYAGYTYRRSLVNAIHNTTLVFMGNQTVPFGPWMLRDMQLSNGARLEVFPDPWNATKGRAFQIVREELQAIAQAESEVPVQAQTEIVSSRRVYMPTYVIDYKVLGIEYQAFVSGCDQGAAVSGESHKVLDLHPEDAYHASQDFLSRAASAAQSGVRVLGGRGLFVLLQLFGSLLARVLVRLPLIGVLAGTFVGFRKILQPFFNRRFATAEWERQREHEAAMKEGSEYQDDFVDSGRTAQQYFQRNRERILRSLSGQAEREKGDFDWYAQWEQWAQRQWAQQQQQQQQTSWQQQSQQQKRTAKSKPQVDFQWDFDPDDPYSVLGVKRNASKSEISAAYRKQMLKYHPDTQGPDVTEAEKVRAEERAKLINEAYKKLKHT